MLRDGRVVLHIFNLVVLGVLHGEQLEVFELLIELFLLCLVLRTSACFVVIRVVWVAPATEPYGQIPVVVRLRVPLNEEFIIQL